MSNRANLQSHPSTATCPSALDLEGSEPAPTRPHPATSGSSTESSHPRPLARITADGVDLAAISGSMDYLIFDRPWTVDSAVGAASIGAKPGQATVQASLARLELRSPGGTLTLSGEALATKASTGTINPDGSIGRNVSLGTTIVAGELTLTHSGNSMTLGAGAGDGIEFSIGTRDLDGDNRPEFCSRLSAAILTVGFCLENPL